MKVNKDKYIRTNADGSKFNKVRLEPYISGKCIWCKANTLNGQLFCNSYMNRNGITGKDAFGNPTRVCQLDADNNLELDKKMMEGVPK